MNEELLSSAVSFLQDPNVSSSPLTKKVEFLESKGLNQQEIEEALKRANSSETSTQVIQPQHQQPQPQQPPIDYYNATPSVPDRSWKDYFIMATATAGVTYGLYQVVTRYLVPSILPAKQSSLDQDKAKIDEEFMKIDKLLDQMEKDQQEIKSNNEDKLKEVDIVIDNVNDFLSKYNKDKLKFDDDLRLMKLEIDNLRSSIEKHMNLTKENIKDELEEIDEELTSLKNLIKARAENASSNTKDYRKVAPVSSIPSASEILKKTKSATPPASEPFSSAAAEEQNRAGKTTVGGVTAGGIPAWQLQHKQQEEKNQENQDKSNEKSQSTPSIPLWQQSGLDDAKVQEGIAKAGVPSWQLNA